MEKLIVVKFGGSAIGINGEGLPTILKRIRHLKDDSKVIVVCSAPLTTINDQKISLTDVILSLGKDPVNPDISMEIVYQTYSKILEMVNDDYKEECNKKINDMLILASKALEDAKALGRFEDEIRAKALAYSGEY